MYERIPGAFDDAPGDSLPAITSSFDDQPFGNEDDSATSYSAIQNSADLSPSHGSCEETVKGGFICRSCSNPRSQEAGPSICNLAALGCIQALFAFDKDGSLATGVGLGQNLDEKKLFEVLATLTERLEGHCQRPVPDLLGRSLFSESLAVSRQTTLSNGSSLEDLVLPAFSAMSTFAEGQPVAFLITRPDTNPFRPQGDQAVAVAVQLRSPFLRRFVLITPSTATPAGQVCIHFYDSDAALCICKDLSTPCRYASKIYTLTPGAACTFPYSETAIERSELSLSNGDCSDIFNGEDTTAPSAQGSISAPIPSARGSLSERDSQPVTERQQGDNHDRSSPPPPYEEEAPSPTQTTPTGASETKAPVVGLLPSPDTLSERSPQSLSTTSKSDFDLPSRQGTSAATTQAEVSSTRILPRKPSSSEFGWMQALQSAGPIIHSLPSTSSTQKSVLAAKPIGVPIVEENPPCAQTASNLRPQAPAFRHKASTRKAPSRKAGRVKPSSVPTAHGPQFFDTDQLDLLFPNSKQGIRGKEVLQPPESPEPDPANARGEPSAWSHGVQDNAGYDLQVLASTERLPIVEELGVKDDDQVEATLSPRSAMKQKEHTGTIKRKDFEWQLGLMGTTKTPLSSKAASSPKAPSSSKAFSPSKAASSSKAPPSSKAASSSKALSSKTSESPLSAGVAGESSRSSRVDGPWSPLMLRPELLELDDDFDTVGGSSSTNHRKEWDPPLRKAKSFKAHRNDIAWQLALVSTVLKPSEEYMKQREAKFIQLNPRYKPERFDCLICFESIAGAEGSRMMNCEHSFCRECIAGHVRSQLEENLYPIICPVCFPDPERTTRGFVDDFILDELDLTQKELDKFEDLQLAAVIVKIDCPGCKQVLVIAREDYLNEPFIRCNLPECTSRFCRACLKVMDGPSDEHTCKVDEELDALMKANGWRYCPGCRTPILKESGCNHMTCRTPGCSAHFCYVCGDSIWDATSLESLTTLLSAHYRNCNQFDPDPPPARGPGGARRRRENCAIQ